MTPYERAKKLIEWLTPQERRDLVHELNSYPPYSKREVLEMRFNGRKASDWLWDHKQYREIIERLSASCKLSIEKDL